MTCVLDGIRVDCAFVGSTAVQCPENNCGPKRVVYQGQPVWAYFHAFNDGFSGFIPVTARYTGNGGIAPRGTGGPPRRGPRSGPKPPRPDSDWGRLNGAAHTEAVLGYSRLGDLPQRPTPEQAASARAAELLREKTGCSNFITELIALTSVIAIQPFNAPPTPTFHPILGPNGFEPSFEPNIGLTVYNGALDQGRVTASGRSGTRNNIITYGTTTGHRTIVWNAEFYALSLNDQALMTLHESLHFSTVRLDLQ